MSLFTKIMLDQRLAIIYLVIIMADDKTEYMYEVTHLWNYVNDIVGY